MRLLQQSQKDGNLRAMNPKVGILKVLSHSKEVVADGQQWPVENLRINQHQLVAGIVPLKKNQDLAPGMLWLVILTGKVLSKR